MEENKDKLLSLITSGADINEIVSFFGIEPDSLTPETGILISSLVSLVLMLQQNVTSMNDNMNRMDSTIGELGNCA